ncbi:MAG: FHA domain-containing serine/threonine-protein kinase [Planctomycetota bacterium]
MIGTKVGQYSITQEIGDGGHAFVFRGEGEGRSVAIKMLKPSVADEDNLEKRFVIEAEALKELVHPSIVGFHEYIFLNGYHYLVLEYMDQGSIEDLLDTMGPLAHRYAIPIFYKILQAMQFSHEHNYIHRDMKPNNILINSEGEAKLTDFGIAKVVGGQNLTQKGFVLGTTLYMAPEFISQGKVTVQTDIYAMGVTFYEMLTNRKPFEFERDDEPLVNFARRVCKGESTPPSEFVDIPRDLERIVLKSLAQNTKERYKTAAEFAKDLAKSFPELVNRAIVIPKGTGRVMTRYHNIDEEGLSDLLPDSGGPGMSTAMRGILAGAAGLVLAVAIAMLPKFWAGASEFLSESLRIGAGVGAGACLGLVLFKLLPKKSVSKQDWIRAANPKSKDETPGGAGLSSSELEGFNAAADSVIPDVDMEDTIPFQDPGATSMGNKPFKMTDVSELEAYLVVTSGPDEGRRFGLRPVSRIGRDLRLDLRPHDPEISRHHAVLTFDGTGFTAEDLGSTNGTYVNEDRLTAKVRLKNGDTVRVGSTMMRFEYRPNS